MLAPTRCWRPLRAAARPGRGTRAAGVRRRRTSTQDLTRTRQGNNERKKEMSFLRSPARRSVLCVTGVVVAVGLATAGSSAYAFTAGAGSGRAVSSQPPAGLQQAADQLVADGVPGAIIMTRRGQQVSNVV